MRIGIQFVPLEQKNYGRFSDKAYLKLKEHGYEAVDFSLTDTDSVLYTSHDESIRHLKIHKTLSEEAGVKIHQVHGPWKNHLQGTTPKSRAELMVHMKRSIEMTSYLGAEYFVIHPIMTPNLDDAGKPEADVTWEANLIFMTELLKTAKDNDVTICLENMPFGRFSISKPADTYRFVKEMNDSKFKMCLDTGHVSVFELSPADAIREMHDEIKTLHVHDNKFKMDMHMMPYFGQIDWADFGKALHEAAFDGVFSLEVRPPASLPTDLFEEFGSSLHRIAESIINK